MDAKKDHDNDDEHVLSRPDTSVLDVYDPHTSAISEAIVDMLKLETHVDKLTYWGDWLSRHPTIGLLPHDLCIVCMVCKCDMVRVALCAYSLPYLKQPLTTRHLYKLLLVCFTTVRYTVAFVQSIERGQLVLDIHFPIHRIADMVSSRRHRRAISMHIKAILL